ncbi:MAG: methyltransferase domain-containing protein [Polyangia bacterium]
MDRNSILLTGLEKSMLGMEIGASFNPLASKKAGWNVKVVDHAPRDVLREKYKSRSDINIDQIEEVDVVWQTKTLHECFDAADHHSFDYCLASHLIEHIPDLLSFLHSLETLLKPNGVLSLAIPDKRFEFDAFKPISTTADVLQAHKQRHQATRHSAKVLFENIAYNVTNGEALIWPQIPINDLKVFSSFSETHRVFETDLDDPAEPYHDCHAWYFTPSSFRLMMTELRALGKTRFVVERLVPSQGSEFYVRMRLDGKKDAAAQLPSNDERMALMLAILAEQAQQYSLVGDALRQRLIKLLPEEHPFPGGNSNTGMIEQLLNSHSWRLVTAFWTNVDKVKKILRPRKE